MAKKVVVVGGGWAGTAAALAARHAGCEVELFERADMLLGTGLVGGIMRNNGRFTVCHFSPAFPHLVFTTIPSGTAL